MIIKNINMEKIKKISKRKLFAVGLISVVFLSGCYLKSNNKIDKSELNNTTTSNYTEQESKELTTINFTFNNSDAIEDYDIIFMNDSDGELCGGMRVYNLETHHTMDIPSQKFIIHSNIVGEISIDATQVDEFNVTIDYLNKTMEVEKQFSMEKIK